MLSVVQLFTLSSTQHSTGGSPGRLDCILNYSTRGSTQLRFRCKRHCGISFSGRQGMTRWVDTKFLRLGSRLKFIQHWCSICICVLRFRLRTCPLDQLGLLDATSPRHSALSQVPAGDRTQSVSPGLIGERRNFLLL